MEVFVLLLREASHSAMSSWVSPSSGGGLLRLEQPETIGD